MFRSILQISNKTGAILFDIIPVRISTAFWFGTVLKSAWIWSAKSFLFIFGKKFIPIFTSWYDVRFKTANCEISSIAKPETP